MSSGSLRDIKFYQLAGFLFAAVLIAVEFAQTRVQYAKLFPSGAPHEVADGMAAFPFQYRVLVPFLTKLLAAGTGAGFYVTASVIEVLAVAALLLLSAFWCWRLTRSPAGAVLVLLLSAAMFRVHYVTAPMNNYYYQSDIFAALFLVAGILLIAADRWGWLAAAVALATLNRETAVMLIPIAVIAWSLRQGWRIGLARAVPAVAAFLVAKVLLWWVFAGQGGGLGQFFAGDPLTGETRSRFMLNLVSLLQWQAWLVLAPIFGFAWIAVLLGGRTGETTLDAALAVFPLFVGALLVAGIITEIRIFGDYIPVFAVAAVYYVFRPGGIGAPRGNGGG